MRLTKKKKLLYGILVAAILCSVVILAWPAKKLNGNNGTENHQTDKTAGPKTAARQFDKYLYPTDEASSLWAVVNKGRSLPSGYTPADLTVPQMHLRYSLSSPAMHLRADAAAALGDMFEAARNDGLELMLTSGYRSYADQESVYGNYVKTDGAAKADTFSARPGHSEHQTGLAADIEPYSEKCELNQCFGDTPEGRWLAANCYKFGFIIRYPKDKERITGYEYEPWHVRFVGMALAVQLHVSGQTLEQFFSLPIYPDYPANVLTLKI